MFINSSLKMLFTATKSRYSTVLPRQSRDFQIICRDKAAIFTIFAATLPRFSRFFCRDNAAIFRILACCGTAIFGLNYRDKFLPLLMTISVSEKSQILTLMVVASPPTYEPRIDTLTQPLASPCRIPGISILYLSCQSSMRWEIEVEVHNFRRNIKQ